MRAVDVFCGAGGVTDGMLAAGFEVVGVDVVQRPEYRGRLVLKDVRDLDPSELGPVDWLHGSPPCQRFSLARCNRKADPPTEADLHLLRAFLRLRDAIQPRFWSVENVRGALPWFRPILGEPTLRHGAFYFWGNFPPFLAAASGLRKGIYGSQSPRTRELGKQTKPRDPWLSARVPIQLSEPMARAVAAGILEGA